MKRLALRLPEDGVWSGGVNYIETVCRALLGHPDVGYEPIVFCSPRAEPWLRVRFQELLGARGICLLPARRRAAAIGLALLVPLGRFGPRYITLAADLAAGREHAWVDVAMDRDSREAAVLTRSLKAAPPDSLFVWGFRPELYVYTGLPAASRFLDSQPVTGVPADRHLFDSTSVIPELAATNRQELIRSRPTLILDGLGPYNPQLAIASYPDLQVWLADYRPAARTRNTIVYRRLEP